MSGYVAYQYDSLGNLITSWDSAGVREEFAYDPADNRTQTQVTSGSAPPPPAQQASARSFDVEEVHDTDFPADPFVVGNDPP
jgi:YD repeat-containing protein